MNLKNGKTEHDNEYAVDAANFKPEVLLEEEKITHRSHVATSRYLLLRNYALGGLPPETCTRTTSQLSTYRGHQTRATYH